MGYANNIGKYHLGRTIGEGTFAKVKLAVNSITNDYVAIKIIDKHMVVQSNLKSQVAREIRTMKLLHHPNIVRIHEVIGTKTKIYIVMEYVSGGQLSDKLTYSKKLNESEARKVFQQLIDAVDYCHNRGVYHRDLKPENLLLDAKGNLKVSDFGLSALQKHGDILKTACGSPCYVAPELLANKGYDGAAADIWSCGVILFELLAGFLPFDDRNIMALYRKISQAEYTYPQWFTRNERNLISRIFDPNPKTRITIAEIIENAWFQTGYVPSCGFESSYNTYFNDVNVAFDATEDDATETPMRKSSSFINAFQLIAMSHDLDLSGLFKEQEDTKKTRLGSKNTLDETIKKIEAAAMNVSLSIEKKNNFKVMMHPKHKVNRCRSYYDLSAEVTEVSPTNCVIEISKSAGELKSFEEFCKSLSSILTEKSSESMLMPESTAIRSKDTQETEVNEKPGIQAFQFCSFENRNCKEQSDPHGYSSS